MAREFIARSESVGWIKYAQVSDQWRVIVNNVMNYAQDSDQGRVIMNTVMNYAQDSDQGRVIMNTDELRSG